MTLLQNAFRVGIEEGTESSHGWHAAQNTNLSFAVDTTFLIRFLVQAAASVAHNNIDLQYQYNYNSAGYVNITTTSSILKAVTTLTFTNGTPCTNRLTGGTGTFESSGAGCTHTGLAGGAALDFVANGFTETEGSVQIVGADVTNGSTIQIRLLQEGAVLDAYNQTPTITVIKVAAGGSSPQLTMQTPAMMSLLMR